MEVGVSEGLELLQPDKWEKKPFNPTGFPAHFWASGPKAIKAILTLRVSSPLLGKRAEGH
jgi:hypothetical protein